MVLWTIYMANILICYGKLQNRRCNLILITVVLRAYQMALESTRSNKAIEVENVNFSNFYKNFFENICENTPSTLPPIY